MSIDCDECLRRLIEENKGNTPERRQEYDEHVATCEDCKTDEPAYAAYQAEMAKPHEPDPDDPVRKAVLAYAEAHIAMKNAKPRPKIRFPWKPLLAVAAVGLAGLLLAPQLTSPPATTFEQPTLDSGKEPTSPADRMKWAGHYHRLGYDDLARKYAQLVADDEKAPPELREEAKKLLAKLK
ncbi:MAG TPA: hypothetical protein VFF73_01085 [Planctomycetota bacterium]|nr:hypothetical protein [Planctomycetota bacterium]